MLARLLLFLNIVLCPIIWAQADLNINIDQLKKKALVEENLNEQAKLLLDIGDYYYSLQRDSCIYYLTQAYHVSSQTDNLFLRGRIAGLLGTAYEVVDLELSAKYIFELYLVTIGTSDYKDDRYDLTYPVKDAKDLSNLMISNPNETYNDIYVEELYDKGVTNENISKLKSFLKRSGPNDEEEENEDDIAFRSVGDNIKEDETKATPTRLASELFNDLRRGTGATVISSAGGAEFAMESDKWKNGLFTYCMLNGLKNGTADLDGDGRIMLLELQEYVVDKVTALSHGRQAPNSRIQNIELDFQIW